MADVIRNCNFILQCPTYWDALGETEEPSVRYCEPAYARVLVTVTPGDQAVSDNSTR